MRPARKTGRRWLASATLAATCAIASPAADPAAALQGSPGRTVRLLTVGNSFSQNATKYLDDLAAADGNLLIHHGAVLGGATMSQHWAKVEFNDRDPADPRGRYSSGRSLREELAAEKWDFVTIQQASIRSHDVATYRPWAEQLAGFIRKLAPQAELLVHQTWAYRRDDPRFTKPSGAAGEPSSRAGMHAMLTRAYDTIAAELGARVLPVGDAFDRADRDPERGYQPDPAFDFASARPPALPDPSHSLHVGWRWTTPTNGPPKLTMDGHHAGLAGEYLAACVWYEVLFRTSVLRNRFAPRGLDAQTAEFLRRTAHASVEARASRSAVAARPKIIFDTDMRTDCDDAAALGVLHALADAGECEILATVVSVPDAQSAAAVDAINAWYGRPALPLGMVKRGGVVRPSPYAAGLATGCPNRVRSADDVPDAVATCREVLEQQPDGSVTVVTVGYLTNLADLLDRPPEGGRLSGTELVRRKVGRWVCMGGNFVGDPPKDDLRLGNVNFQKDAASAVRAIGRWPTPVVFVGREIGSVPSGLEAGACLSGTPPDHPVRRAYELYFGGTAKNRHVADPTAVLFAVRGLGDSWDIRTGGRMDIRADASFEWRPDAKGRHSYLVRKRAGGGSNDARVVQALEELLVRPPRARSAGPPPVPAEARTARAAESLAAYRAELDACRRAHGGSRELPDVSFFLFGMGHRAKYVYRGGERGGVLAEAFTGREVRRWIAAREVIVPCDYAVTLTLADGSVVVLREDEEAVWLTEGGRREAVAGTASPVRLPAFAGCRFPRVLRGRSDFAEHPVYQTKWMKFGLRAPGLPDPYVVPAQPDRYGALFWMDFRDAHTPGRDADDRDADPYLGWACDHFHGAARSPLGSRDYPLTWERHASQARYEGMRTIAPVYVERRLAAPHTWHAAEAFLLLLGERAEPSAVGAARRGGSDA